MIEFDVFSSNIKERDLDPDKCVDKRGQEILFNGSTNINKVNKTCDIPQSRRANKTRN